MTVPISPGAIAIINSAARGGGPAPTLDEVAVICVATVLGLWLMFIPIQWIMNMATDEEPSTLRGVIIQHVRFVCRAATKLW